MDREKVYITINKKSTIDIGEDILISKLGQVYSPNPSIRKSIENLRIKKKPDFENWDYLKVTDITEKVLTKFPNIDLTLLGEVEILLEYKSQEEPKPFLEFIKVAIVCILLFFGASLAIINFHEDVNTSKSMKELYFTFTGEKKDNPLIMVIPYSFGIGIGVITFFSRILSSSKRRKKEPGPMELELFLYDENMESQILNETKNNDSNQ